MPTFRPPTDNFLNLSDFDIEEPYTEEVRVAHRLLRFFQAMPRGRNIYLLSNGTYVENEPADMTTVVRVYEGGHDHDVTASEASALTAAGYGAYIS